MRFWTELKIILALALALLAIVLIPVMRAKYAQQACDSLCLDKKHIAKVSLGVPMTCECLKAPSR